MFWSSVIAAALWTVGSVACGWSVLALSLATCTLAAVLYTWISSAHGNRWFVYFGIGVFSLGYLGVYLVYDGVPVTPVYLVLFALAPATVAVCMGYLSVLFRSRSFAYVTTVAAQGACFLFLRAGVEAAKLHSFGWYALGIAAIGFASLWVYRTLAGSKFGDLAFALAHGSDVAATIAACYAVQVGGEHHWTIPATMAVCAATYALSACFRNRPWFLYAACAAAAGGWCRLLGLLPNKYTGSYMVSLFLSLPVILGALSYAIRGRDRAGFAVPLWRSAMTLSVLCIPVQLVGDLFGGLYGGQTEVSTFVTWMAFSASYAIASYLDRDIPNRAEMLTYFSCATFLIGVTASWSLVPKLHPAYPFIYAALGALWVGVGVWLQSRSRITRMRPLFVCAGVAESIAVLSANFPLESGSGWGIATLVTAPVVFAWVAQKSEKPIVVHLAGCAALGGLGLLNVHHVAQWILLMPVLIPALGAGVLAQTTRAREYACWSPVLLLAGFAEYAWWTSSVLSPAPSFCAAFIVAMGLGAVMFRRLARMHDMPAFDVFSAFSGLVAYWCIPVLLYKVIPFDPVAHVGITILPYALFLAWLSLRVRCCGGELHYQSYGAVALALSVVGVAACAASGESLTLRTVTLALYTLSYLLTAARFASIGLAYVTNASGLVTWFMLYHALKLPSLPDGLPCLGVWFGMFGLAQLSLGLVFERLKNGSKTAQIEINAGTALCSVVAAVALCSTLYTQLFGVWAIAALLMSTVASSTVAMVRRQLGLVHAGFAGVLISLYLIFYDKLDRAALDVYALPIGIYLLALPAISRCVGREVRPNPYYSTGLAIILGSGLVSFGHAGWKDWNSYMLLVESVVAFLYGISRRVKVFLFFGTGFSLVWTAVLVRDSVVRQMHGGTLVAGIIGIIIGTALIVFASRSEQKRAEILNSIRQVARSFQEWD